MCVSACRVLSFAAAVQGAAAITNEMKAVLDQHNIYRCMHGVPLLTWDEDIARNAQKWADNGVWDHSSKESRVVNGERCGENLAWEYPTRSGKASTVSWYSEIEFTDPYGTADSMSDSKPAGEAIGHYTQVVWSTSLRLGCGSGRATVSGKEGDFWVCQYGPAGNFGGQFSDKVKPPVKTADECKDAPESESAEGGDSSASSGGSSSNSADVSFPPLCTPSPLLPIGGLCVFGYQCESKFCCPRLKVCLTDAKGSISTSDIKVREDERKDIVSMINSGGACRDHRSNLEACVQDQNGQPLVTWDQSQCGCTERYMKHYTAGTWVTLNDIPGLKCGSIADDKASQGGIKDSTTRARGLDMIACAAVAAAVAFFAMYGESSS